jgi:hypothetical protein
VCIYNTTTDILLRRNFSASLYYTSLSLTHLIPLLSKLFADEFINNLWPERERAFDVACLLASRRREASAHSRESRALHHKDVLHFLVSLLFMKQKKTKKKFKHV